MFLSIFWRINIYRVTQERIVEYERLVTGCKNFGIDSYIIDPAEAKNKFPFLDQNAFVAAVYTPADGVIDPAMLVNALTKSAERNGCKVYFHQFFYYIQYYPSTYLGNIYYINESYDRSLYNRYINFVQNF